MALLAQQWKQLLLLQVEMARDLVLQGARELRQQLAPERVVRRGRRSAQARRGLRQPVEQADHVEMLLVQLPAGLAPESAHGCFGRRSRTRTALPMERGISPGFFTTTSVVMPTIDLIWWRAAPPMRA